MSGWKKAVGRGLQGFAYATTINLLIGVIMMLVNGRADFVPVLPEFAKRFISPMLAFCVQCLLIGLTSMAFATGSLIMENAKWSLVVQSILYFIVTSAVWIPVSIFCWGLGRYHVTFISVTVSYLIGYVISWTVQYRICKRDVEKINQRLKELNAHPEK